MFRAFGQQLRPRFSRGITQALTEPTAWNQAPVVVSTLPNGVKVATKKAFSETSSVGIYLNAGTRDETKETAGAVHLIEQLAFTGTARRSKAELESEVESLGALLSMKTGREQSSYSINVCSKDLKKGVDIVADLVTSVPVGNLEKEKGAVLQRLEDTEPATRAVIDDRLHACAFRDYTLGFSSIGPFDGVEALTTSKLQSYLDTTYTADRMVIAAVGPGDHEELVQMASSALGGVQAGTPPAGALKPYFCGAELIYRNDEMGPTAYISVGWEAVPWRSPDAVTFMVMQAIIGSYKKKTGLVPGTISGNRVINNVANKMEVGCADEFEAFCHFYKDTGMFGFYIACDEVAVEHAIGELMFGANLLSFSVTDEEVERGKRELKSALFGGNGTVSAQLDEIGKQVLAYGRGIPPAEMMLRIEAVDAEEVKRVAWKYLNDNEIAVTALGPLHGMPSYYELRRQTIMHRY
eukprot:CAMPEP_0171110426 /NCGR_PEP_ID=MMETSP0766_2-20121228/71340_1 /TAXON_ID=439317 /ORGANISM="Gambierdiscus australes, Strain CAWD 149" /LENGTH=465 /DNA_ID=CAMNT_0011572289 /DNA_START=43 /DNA_END=1440 /DNA_ORIENTATION=-